MEKEHLLLSCSPPIDIDGIEAVIVHIDKADSRYWEHIDIQMPGHHILNRIGFQEPNDLRDVIELIDEKIDFIWQMAYDQL